MDVLRINLGDCESRMDQQEWDEFIDTSIANVRRHAGYFSWLSDRDIEEVGVVKSFQESLTHDGRSFFHSMHSRGRGNDPPDCEARLCAGGRVGIEVTELVDGQSIIAAKTGGQTPWEPFSKNQLLGLLTDRIKKKDNPIKVKGDPYEVYLLLIYCDEPRVLDYNLIKAIEGCTFPSTMLIDRVFVLFSYSPWEKRCPYVELTLSAD